MAVQLGESRGAKAAINVTPMIDVLLVLLIIFMVVVNSRTAGFAASVPRPPSESPAPEPDSPAIVVRLQADGAILLNRDVVKPQDLEASFAQLRARAGNPPVFVTAQADIEFQNVVRVMDAARGVGLDRIGLLPHGSF